VVCTPKTGVCWPQAVKIAAEKAASLAAEFAAAKLATARVGDNALEYPTRLSPIWPCALRTVPLYLAHRAFVPSAPCLVLNLTRIVVCGLHSLCNVILGWLQLRTWLASTSHVLVNNAFMTVADKVGFHYGKFISAVAAATCARAPSAPSAMPLQNIQTNQR
jgi:hypothetical protein